jgi:carbonic anhydrase
LRSWSRCAAGKEQSPIDLVHASPIDLPPVVVDTPSREEVRVLNQQGVIDALDNGHTIQINAPTGGKLIVGDVSYGLVQFHFHAPSEHTRDGVHYPMEIHFVSQAADGSLAVLGLLAEAGDQNPAIEPLWDQLQEAPGSETTLRLPPDFAQRVFIGTSTGLYHYQGSLTTPPCSEEVQWYVRRTPTQLSREQIDAFTAIYNGNNRPVQPLGDRRLFLDEAPSVRIE